MNPTHYGADILFLFSALVLAMCGIALVGFSRLNRRPETSWLAAFFYLRAGIATIGIVAVSQAQPHPAWVLGASVLDIAAGMCAVEFARRTFENAGHRTGKWIHFFVLAAALPFAYSLRLDPLWTAGALATLLGTSTAGVHVIRTTRGAALGSEGGLRRLFYASLTLYGLAGICFPVMRRDAFVAPALRSEELWVPFLSTVLLGLTGGALYWYIQGQSRRPAERREWVMRSLVALGVLAGAVALGLALGSWIPASRFAALLVTLLVSLLLLASFHAQERVREQMGQMARSDHRSAALIESMPNPMQLCNRSGHSMLVNRAWRIAFGLHEHEMPNRRFTELWPEAVRPQVEQAVATTIHGTPSRFEAEYQHPEGRRMLFSVATNPVVDDDGQLTGFVAVCADITARRKNELALLAAKNAAEAATQAKTEILTVMGHEIRTPLGGVIGLLEALRRMPQPPNQRKHTELAIDSAEALLETLDHILDAARLEAGKFTLEPHPFQPVVEFARVLEGQRIRAQTSHLELKVHMAPDLPTSLVGDATRLRQVLANLVTNAIKFTRRGHVLVTVGGEPCPGLQHLLRIQVSDTGIGISPEMQQKLLQRVGGADDSAVRQGGITGLGLSIVKSIVDLMNGEIRVVSEPGKGTSFTIEVCLPLGPALSEKPTVAVASNTRPPIPLPGTSAAPSATAVISPDVGSLKVLCAEDNATNRLIIQLLLEGMGHTVAFGEDGQQAVERLSREAFDLVLMDNRMPVMDGFQATRIIRDPTSPVLSHDIPVIALTANASKSYRDQCLASGMNDYLTKPVREQALRSAIARAMQGRSRVVSVEGRAPTNPPLSVQPPAPQASEPSPTAPEPGTPDEAAPPELVSAEGEITGMSEEELMALLDEADQEPQAADPSASLSPDARRKISQQYLNETPRLLNQLRLAWIQRDAVTLSRSGHSLKSSSRYVQATRLSDIGKQIEKLADQQAFDKITPLLSETDREFELVNERLQGENQN
ncbi:ATP-binding protein [Nibricoccus sp. IMCC34717]|uniref:ATP-binding protein n=1 Tax=Nibricoccus sp. IMCC34717 TaxID=3034021 RepID=UPI00384B5A94